MFKKIFNNSSSNNKPTNTKRRTSPPSVVRMHMLSDTMEKAEIAKWHVKVGDYVQTGQLVADIETDKAVMEYESYEDGTVLYLGVKEKGTLQVDDILLIIGNEGDKSIHLLEGINDEVQESFSSPNPSETEPKEPSLHVLRMPQISESINEAEITKWFVKEGDEVAKGQLIAEIDTDKVSMEYESTVKGTILYLAVEQQTTIKVGEILTIIGEKGQAYQHVLQTRSGDDSNKSKDSASIESSTNTIDSKKESSEESSTQFHTIADIGEVKLYAGRDVPQGWLPCNGRSYLIEEHKALFAVIGTKFGSQRDYFQVPKIESIAGVNYIIKAE